MRLIQKQTDRQITKKIRDQIRNTIVGQKHNKQLNHHIKMLYLKFKKIAR